MIGSKTVSPRKMEEEIAAAAVGVPIRPELLNLQKLLRKAKATERGQETTKRVKQSRSVPPHMRQGGIDPDKLRLKAPSIIDLLDAPLHEVSLKPNEKTKKIATHRAATKQEEPKTLKLPELKLNLGRSALSSLASSPIA